MSQPVQEHVTQLLDRIEEGDGSASEELLPLVYEELRRLAQHFLAQERRDHTLQATAVVHEAYLRLVGQAQTGWKSRSHFFALAAKMIRRVLVDHARAHNAEKRGEGNTPLSLDGVIVLATPGRTDIDVLALHEALNKLDALQPRQARVVELRFFAGSTVEETAMILDVSPRTVKNDWRFAKAWLRNQLEEDDT